MNPADFEHDVFVAHAGPDTEIAREVFLALEEAGIEAFLDAESLDPGAIWADELPRAQKASWLTLVLISLATDKAFYAKEEIAQAIALARVEGAAHRVVPFYLDEGVEPPYGLRGVHSVRGTDRTTRAEAIAKVVALCKKRRSEGTISVPSSARGLTPESTPPAQPRDVLDHLAAAIELDRTAQWGHLIEVCSGTEPAIFLMHGERRLGVTLFIQRVHRCLNAVRGVRAHRICVVPFRREAERFPPSAEAWLSRVRMALAELVAGSGAGASALPEAHALLARTSAVDPLMLILGERPLGPEDLRTPEEREGLETFLASTLPPLLRHPGRHPVRVVVGADHGTAGAALGADLDGWLRRGCATMPPRYVRLPKLRTPDWEDDIVPYLDKLTPRPSRTSYERLEAAFRQLDLSTVRIEEIAELLERNI